MRLLCNTTDYTETIEIAKGLSGTYDGDVIFHAFWSGDLTEKHLMSIQSCYHFNVRGRTNRKIIVWVEQRSPNEWNDRIREYADIRAFNYIEEQKDTPMDGVNTFNTYASFYSDVVRYTLLYKYGGCWFDLDVFFLRSFDPLFVNYPNDILVYTWENQQYPNGAVYISLAPRSEKMKLNIEFIRRRNMGWGFQESDLTFNLPLDMLVLPCSWFDPAWISNPYEMTLADFFSETARAASLKRFFSGAFCYHWHNRWHEAIHDTSIARQLYEQLEQ